jgi:ribosomal protein L40E
MRKMPRLEGWFNVPYPETDDAAPILIGAVAAAPQQRTKKCRFCGEDIPVVATKCRHCGEWLQRPPGMPAAQTGIKNVPPANAAIFTIITLGIYQLFWLYRVFKELHARGSTQTTPGKAVGFLFIPFFNFAWIFIVWKTTWRRGRP